MNSRRLRVYISATADLEAEREVVGEALAKFPAPLPWEIRRTPQRGDQKPEALGGIADSDFYLILLGQDVSAPVGAELEEALSHHLPLLALVKDVPHTPAGQFFRHNSIERWEHFADARGLRLRVTQYLASLMLDQAARYGLSPEAIAALTDYVRQSPGKQQDDDAVTGHGEPAGAQEAAVIVGGPLRSRR